MITLSNFIILSVVAIVVWGVVVLHFIAHSSHQKSKRPDWNTFTFFEASNTNSLSPTPLLPASDFSDVCIDEVIISSNALVNILEEKTENVPVYDDFAAKEPLFENPSDESVLSEVLAVHATVETALKRSDERQHELLAFELLLEKLENDTH